MSSKRQLQRLILRFGFCSFLSEDQTITSSFAAFNEVINHEPISLFSSFVSGILIFDFLGRDVVATVGVTGFEIDLGQVLDALLEHSLVHFIYC